MIKTVLIVCAMCAAGAGTTVWVSAGGKPAANLKTVGAAPTAAMPSLQELHANAHLESLPVRAGFEPF
jgi:hypothetical protein